MILLRNYITPLGILAFGGFNRSAKRGEQDVADEHIGPLLYQVFADGARCAEN